MSIEELKIVGANSRLASLVALSAPGGHFTLRPTGSGKLPEVLDGMIVIFSDPPSIENTRSAFIDLLSRIPPNSNTRIVLISSISAAFPESTIFPSQGPYTQRKRLAEQILQSRTDILSVIIRLGNIREFGGWHDIFKNSKAVILPAECKKIAIGNVDELRQKIVEGASSKYNKTLECYALQDIDDYFPRVIRVPGLLALYKNKMSRIALKIISKVLRKFSIYLPSADDLNCFLMDRK